MGARRIGIESGDRRQIQGRQGQIAKLSQEDLQIAGDDYPDRGLRPVEAGSVPRALEILYGSFMPLGGSEASEGAEIAPLAGPRILLARIEPIAARAQLANHGVSRPSRLGRLDRALCGGALDHLLDDAGGMAVDGGGVPQAVGVADHPMRDGRARLDQEVEAVTLQMSLGRKRVVEGDSNLRVFATEFIYMNIRRRPNDLEDDVGRRCPAMQALPILREGRARREAQQ